MGLMIYSFKPPILKLLKSKADLNRIELSICLGPGGSGKLTEPLKAIFDPGADTLVIPKRLIDSLAELRQVEIIGTSIATVADGSTAKSDIAYMDLMIPTAGFPIILSGIETSILENADEILVGSNVLAYFNYSVSNNRLKVFRPNEKLLSTLEPFNSAKFNLSTILKSFELRSTRSGILKPVEGKKPEIEVPSLANNWKFQVPPMFKQPEQPKGLMPRMPTMPDPPTPPKPGENK